MNFFAQIYRGKDLVISRKALEEMGVKPGDTIVIQPQTGLAPPPLSTDERTRRRQISRQLAEGWKADDLADFEQQRQAMWQQWTAFNS